MFFLMFIVTGVLYYTPLTMNVYSPLPAMMSPFSDRVNVEGRIMYINKTPVIGVEVTLFATDELVLDSVFTDDYGNFISAIKFDTGQIITVTIDGQRLRIGYDEPFIDYDATDSMGPFWLGTFIMEE